MAYVSLLLDDHFSGKYTIKEPLLTAGFFDYGTKPEEDWDYHYLRYFGYLSKPHHLEPNGEIFQFKIEMLPPNIVGPITKEKAFENGEVFALPLTSIKNAEDLKAKVTDRLLNRLNECKS